MRLRILELPMEHAGEFSKPPFAFVFDRCELGDLEEIGHGEGMKQATGAQFVLAFQGEVELG